MSNRSTTVVKKKQKQKTEFKRKKGRGMKRAGEYERESSMNKTLLPGGKKTD